MRATWIAALLLQAALAQTVIDPARMPHVVRHLDPQPEEPTVACSVSPVKPVLGFSFRFQAGYTVRMPMSQYEGKGHRWFMLARITPEEGTRQPVYLASRFRLPEVPKTKVELEVSGGYMLGEGRYAVKWMLYDDSGRVCRKDWQIEAKLSRHERAVRLQAPAGSVSEFALHPAGPRAADDAAPIRLTVLLDAAPASPFRTVLRASDTYLMLGTLSALLDRVPVKSLRLVAFNLDQQKELLREDAVSAGVLDDVAQAVANLQLATVDYHILQNPRGRAELLAEMINREMLAQPPSDAVVFLGPRTRYLDKLPEGALANPPGAAPRFLNFEYSPFIRAAPALPDIVTQAAAKAKGKTIVIRTPGDFAKAIDQLERQK